ncbi:MAG TPA: YceI family protein [Pedobacter sp.]|jgi:polyisoprenoid-binding protein YceI
MKYKFILPAFLVVLFFSFKPAATDTFVVDNKNSSIEWVASKIGGSHNGTIKVASGSLVFDGKNLNSGSVNIDMTSIDISDLKGNSYDRLLGHLKSDDFFSVANHPASTFQITSVTPTGTERANVTGNLTIKGITNTITFPATIKRQKNIVVAVAKNVKVDRTKYGIKYRSKNFFGDIGDKAIDDDFEISFNLIAKK